MHHPHFKDKKTEKIGDLSGAPHLVKCWGENLNVGLSGSRAHFPSLSYALAMASGYE